MADSRPPLHLLPQVERCLQRADLAALIAASSRGYVTLLLRRLLEQWRAELVGGRLEVTELTARLERLPDQLERLRAELHAPLLRAVINATGVVVHTNLGRAPYPAATLERIAALGGVYLNLEYDLASGRRGRRDQPLARLARDLFPGFELVAVNNNAAALLLLIDTVAAGREVLVARGELVEIGGSFRMPEILAKSGAILREVGTTNRTRLADYRAALSPATGLLLKVHPSNYRVVGFTQETSLAQLVALGREAGVPVAEDLGSGSLLELKPLGIEDEPTVGSRLALEPDAVTFSGDKLLGGPQAGLIVARPELAGRLMHNPLRRALRLDRIGVLALETTLRLHLEGRAEELPAIAMLRLSPAHIEERCRRLIAQLADPPGIQTELRPGLSMVGGGAAPIDGLPTVLLQIRVQGRSAEQVERRLRADDPPVIARIADDRVTLDLRTVFPDQDPLLLSALRRASR
jgi:L-seryl-tRNA(Ser) seleniumtransferase